MSSKSFAKWMGALSRNDWLPYLRFFLLVQNKSSPIKIYIFIFYVQNYIYIVQTSLVKDHGPFLFLWSYVFSLVFLLVSLYEGPIDREALSMILNDSIQVKYFFLEVLLMFSLGVKFILLEGFIISGEYFG